MLRRPNHNLAESHGAVCCPSQDPPIIAYLSRLVLAYAAGLCWHPGGLIRAVRLRTPAARDRYNI